MLEQYYITLQTPAGTTRLPVAQVERLDVRVVHLTLVGDHHAIERYHVYPATFAANTWFMQGEFEVLELVLR